MEHVHSLGICHCDLSSFNILVCSPLLLSIISRFLIISPDRLFLPFLFSPPSVYSISLRTISNPRYLVIIIPIYLNILEEKVFPLTFLYRYPESLDFGVSTIVRPGKPPRPLLGNPNSKKDDHDDTKSSKGMAAGAPARWRAPEVSWESIYCIIVSSILLILFVLDSITIDVPERKEESLSIQISVYE